jgi:hypothetical protein
MESDAGGILRLGGARTVPRELQLVGLAWVHDAMGDKSMKATRQWVDRLRARGVIHAVPIPGRRLRFRRTEIEGLLRGETKSGPLIT